IHQDQVRHWVATQPIDSLPDTHGNTGDSHFMVEVIQHVYKPVDGRLLIFNDQQVFDHVDMKVCIYMFICNVSLPAINAFSPQHIQLWTGISGNSTKKNCRSLRTAMSRPVSRRYRLIRFSRPIPEEGRSNSFG